MSRRKIVVAAGLAAVFVAVALVAPVAAHAAPLKVAVVASYKTDYWYAHNNETKLLQKVDRQKNVYDVLSSAAVTGREGWDVTLVDDTVFDSVAALQQYDCIVLTQVFCLDVQPSKNLQTYVGQGGGVVCMWGSPRVAPQFDTGPTVTWPEHWAEILHSECGEWGPMSEVYQMLFINDQFWDANGAYFPGGWFTTPVWPGSTNHPVLTGAKTILQNQGYASGDFQLNDPQNSGGRKEGFELTNLLSNNHNTTPILSFKFTNSEALKSYPRSGVVGGYPAAVAARYKSGRSVYFYFCPNHFFLFNWLAATKNSSGVPNRDAATALLESAIRWAGTQDGVTGPSNVGGVTYGDLKVYNDAIYGFQFIGNDGNTSAFGQAEWRVYDPSGKLVQKIRQHGTVVSVRPGQTVRYANTYRPSGGLKSGKYRVEVEYLFNYPWFNKSHKQVAYVVRGQGTGIKTVPVASSVVVLNAPSVSVNPMTPNGDGWGEKSGANFTIDKPALVTVRLKDMAGNTLATPVSNVLMSAGPHYSSIPNVTSGGRALGNGMYNVVVDAKNSAGNTQRASLIFVSRFWNPASLGTNPVISGLESKQAVSIGGTPLPGRVNISYRVSQPCYAVIKIFTNAGEVKTLELNKKIPAGPQRLQWDGTDWAGRALPAGNYRFYVYASSGGSRPAMQLVTGVAGLKR